MVSTRSQSHLSGSSLQTGQDKNADLAAGEVTSKEGAPRSTRRGGRQQQAPAIASLEVIAEEAGPSRVSRKTNKSTDKKSANKDASIDDKLIDKVADNIFAALEDAFGSDGSESLDSEEEEDSSSDEDEEQIIKERNLHWRPNLPGFDFTPSSDGNHKNRKNSKDNAGPSSKAGAAGEDLLDGKRGDTLSKHLYVPSQDARVLHRAAKKNAPDTAGKSWYDLPATTITDEVKNDLRVLRLRSALDPKAFYKKFDNTKFPKYFQFGTVVEGATEFYSSRLSKKQRKRTFTEEIMADSHLTEVRKKRYTKMQEEAARTAPRGGRKTGNERAFKKPHRAKH
jgi:hypothetical protein